MPSVILDRSQSPSCLSRAEVLTIPESVFPPGSKTSMNLDLCENAILMASALEMSEEIDGKESRAFIRLSTEAVPRSSTLSASLADSSPSELR